MLNAKMLGANVPTVDSMASVITIPVTNSFIPNCVFVHLLSLLSFFAHRNECAAEGESLGGRASSHLVSYMSVQVCSPSSVSD